MPTRLTFDGTRTRLLAALARLADADLEPVLDAVCRDLPDWVDAYGVARDADGIWLWLAPAVPGDAPGMGQAVLDLPPGRYMVEVFDVKAHAWIAKESAAASPLVIGVPRRSGGVVLRVARSPGTPCAWPA
jgi:hypothetical protein